MPCVQSVEVRREKFIWRCNPIDFTVGEIRQVDDAAYFLRNSAGSATHWKTPRLSSQSVQRAGYQ